MRYLALDLGEKRTGIALGDDDTFIVSPIGRIEHASEAHFLEQLPGVVKEHEPDALVVGLPLNMDDSVGPQAKKVMDLSKLIEAKTKLTVHLFDERLTSYAADGLMGPMELTRAGKKRRRDALAAVTILRDFMSYQSRERDAARLQGLDDALDQEEREGQNGRDDLQGQDDHT
jgi:putative Holliday junction resolvase